jgi:hypothetical protein
VKVNAKRVRKQPQPKIAEVEVFESSASDSDREEGDDVLGETTKKSRGPTMPRINITERACVENWLQKSRKDGKMKNARWIRNGGAKGQSMTATSCEVKTLGAYESLAMFVNKHCKYAHNDPRVWSSDIAKRRWTSIYKSFKEAMLLGSKGNSQAGSSLEEICLHRTSLLVKQKAKCASFEILEELYYEHPSVNPIQPKEYGCVPFISNSAILEGESLLAFDESESVTVSGRSAAVTTSPLQLKGAAAAVAAAEVFAIVAVTPAVGCGKPVGVATGKAAADFHMKKSKEPKKIELGEAYLQAQTDKLKVYAAAQATKVRADLIQSLAIAGKTPDEILIFVSLV